MKKTQEEKLQLLEETILYYSENPLRRCVTNTNGTFKCFYYGKSNKIIQSEGCAIGRLLPKKMAKAFDNLYEHCDSAVANLYMLIPKRIKNYGKAFLIMLQDLHDKNIHWNENGLSEEGEDFVVQIKRLITNDQI